MEDEIVKDDDHFGATLNIIFICSAPIPINDLDPANLPTNPTALDMYILKNQDIVLTSNWVVDQTITMDFPNCIQAINERFSQLLVLTKQPFNQALVLINQEFKFVNMNSSQKFQAQTTQDLTRVFMTLGHIINQESAFLRQLTLFKDMLTNADILLDVSQRLKRTAPISSSLQQPTTIFEQGLPVKIVNSKLLNLLLIYSLHTQ